jgi:lipoprotein NlpD
MDTGLESKPLEGKPVSSSSPASGLPGLKSGPLGSKVAYTDQAWTDMQRGEPSAARALDTPKKPDAVAASKFSWPTEGRIVGNFDPSRKGIDIAGQSGQAVNAAGDGTVLYAKNMRGYGNLVIVDHGDGLVSAYAHNKTILVKEGQTVARGQRIAEMGDTDADMVKLHFEIRQLGKPVDPVSMLPNR